MKQKFLILLLLLPVVLQAQKLIRCNDSTSFFVYQRNEFYFSIKLLGNTQQTENSRVIDFQNSPIQIMCTDIKDYTSNGSKESTILSTFIMSETEYFSGHFKQKLELNVDPIKFNDNQLAALWYFNLPKEIQESAKPEEAAAVQMISISTIFDDYILSIGTTRFEKDTFDTLRQLLVTLIKSSTAEKGDSNTISFCD